MCVWHRNLGFQELKQKNYTGFSKYLSAYNHHWSVLVYLKRESLISDLKLLSINETAVLLYERVHAKQQDQLQPTDR